MNIYDINIETILKTMNRNGYTIFKNSGKNYNLNIVLIRSANSKAGKFDDAEYIIYQDDNLNWHKEVYVVTVDPGKDYLKKPINKYGTAILKRGQYEGMWRLGQHKGYDALVQNKPCTVVRDSNLDDILDINLIDSNNVMCNDTITNVQKMVNYYNSNGLLVYGSVKVREILSQYILLDGKSHVEHTGIFHINNHRASQWKILDKVGLYSAGCTVHQNPYLYNNDFLPLIRKAIRNYGNSFTVTLLEENEIK